MDGSRSLRNGLPELDNKVPANDEPAVDESDNADKMPWLDEDGDDFAWVQAYSFVFAEGSPVAPSKRKYTHECVPSWQYVYLSDVYELINCLKYKSQRYKQKEWTDYQSLREEFIKRYNRDQSECIPRQQ